MKWAILFIVTVFLASWIMAQGVVVQTNKVIIKNNKVVVGFQVAVSTSTTGQCMGLLCGLTYPQ